jgi:hypothetical protein
MTYPSQAEIDILEVCEVIEEVSGYKSDDIQLKLF